MSRGSNTMVNHGKKRKEDDREIARLMAILKQLPASLVRTLTSSQLSRAFQLDLRPQTIWKAKRHFIEAKDSLNPVESHSEAPAPLWIEQQLVLENIGRVLARTYVHVGDKEQVGSEEALRMIYRELRRYDFSLITRNEKRPGNTAREKAE
jgi:hypothetical protein